MFKRAMILSIVSVVAFSASAQHVAPRLNELIDSALNKDYNTANQQLDVEAAGIKKKQVLENYIPTLEVGGRYAYVNSSSDGKITNLELSALGLTPVLLPDLTPGINLSGNMANAYAKVELLLFSGGKIPAARKAAQENEKAQTNLLETKHQQVMSDVVKSYDQLLLLLQVEKVLEEAQKRFDINKSTALKAYEYGLITQYDLQKVDVAAAQLATKKAEYSGQRALLLAHLNMITHIDTLRLAKINQEITPLQVANKGSWQQRAELAALEAGVKAKYHLMQAEKTWWLPKVKASAQVSYLNVWNTSIDGKTELPLQMGRVDFIVDRFTVFPMYLVGVGFQWDLFDGLKGVRKTKLAKVEWQKSQNSLQQARDLLALNEQQTQTNYEVLNHEILVKKQQQKVAEDALAIATKEFKVGLIKSSDLMTAEYDFQEAALNYLQAVFNQRRAAIAYLQAMGNLSKETINAF